MQFCKTKKKSHHTVGLVVGEQEQNKNVSHVILGEKGRGRKEINNKVLTTIFLTHSQHQAWCLPLFLLFYDRMRT